MSACTATRAHLAMIPAANGGFSRRFVCAEICLRECAYACMHAHIKWSQLAAMVNRACFVRRRCSCYPGFMWVTFGPFLRHCVLKIAKNITYFISEVYLSKKSEFPVVDQARFAFCGFRGPKGTPNNQNLSVDRTGRTFFKMALSAPRTVILPHTAPEEPHGSAAACY